MDTERSGPIEVSDNAEFPDHGLWGVHGDLLPCAISAKGMMMDISGKLTKAPKWCAIEALAHGDDAYVIREVVGIFRL